MSSSVDSSLAPLSPSFTPSNQAESAATQSILHHLNLQPHPEGGYFVETDRDPLRVPNPFFSDKAESRSASTTIFYFLSPQSPLGHFHRNKARTVHTLHKGRGRYVIVHADEVEATKRSGGEVEEEQRWTGNARVETFVVGQNLEKGEKLQWIVEGGKYKVWLL